MGVFNVSHKRIAIAPLLLALSVTACRPSTMNESDIKLNPRPTQAYEMTLTIHDAPGPFDSVKGFVGYESNVECVPVQAISGAKNPLHHTIQIELKEVGLNTYRGKFYMDLLQDEDYFGQGKCHWSFSGIGIPIKVGEVTFGAGATARQLAASGPTYTEYFPKSAYGDNEIPDLTITSLGTNDIATRRVEDFFSTTLTVREHRE